MAADHGECDSVNLRFWRCRKTASLLLNIPCNRLRFHRGECMNGWRELGYVVDSGVKP